ncbi:MAG: hypothetical protein ACOYL6_13510 [Bacteriovoracaceae bacterium]
MKKAHFTKSFLLPTLILFCVNTQASGIHQYCDALVLPEIPIEQRVAGLDPEGAAVFEKYQGLNNTHNLGPFMTREEAVELASEADIKIYRTTFDTLLQKISEKPAEETVQHVIEHFSRERLQAMHFSEAEINGRLQAWHQGGEDRLIRLMGDRTLAEVRKLYMGSELGAISADSLIGKYIEETGAKTKVIQYKVKPDSEMVGPPKVVVAVSAASFEAFKKIVKQDYAMSVLGHANVMFRGDLITFGAQKAEFRLPGNNTPLPFLMMKSSESERFSRYMNLVVQRSDESWNGTTKVPWRLPGYCAQGGYQCCTHWLGNVPIGDLYVNEYKFPGRFENNQPAQIQPLAPYESADAEIKTIWKVPGHQQLASAIGEERSNLQGQFASPGWVIQTLLGKTDNKRVPVIFWVTPDHTVDIPDNYNFNFENPR